MSPSSPHQENAPCHGKNPSPPKYDRTYIKNHQSRGAKKLNFKLCRLMKRVLGLKVVVHRVMQKEKVFKVDKIWALNSDQIQYLMKILTSGWICS